jgi:uncharacterized protein YcbX
VTARVSSISIAPVKGLALAHPEEVSLGPRGVAENRRFYLVDEEGRRYGLLRDGRLVQVEAETDADGTWLSLRFPDGSVVAGDVELGAPVATDFYGRPVEGRLVEGPWAEALSAHAGRPVRILRAEQPGGGVDRDRGPVSLASDASAEELSARAGVPVDPRRFRMLFGIAGARPHEEDDWLGREVRVGDAVVRVLDRVARCAITTQDPRTGERDLDTLRLIDGYRPRDPAGGICFGVWGDVVQPGRVRLEDPVQPL